MNFKKIKYIVAVAELQSISKAASELYISQPSLSYIVSSVEQELGVQIFNRTTNPISLTYAGEKYIKTAKEILQLAGNMSKEFSDISNMKKGKITIGIPSIRGPLMLPFILPKFIDKYPGINIEIVEGNSNFLEDCLLNGKVDLVFTSLPSKDKRIACEILYEEKIMLAAKKGYLSSEFLIPNTINSIDIDKLLNIDFIFTKRGHRMRDFTDKLFDTHKLKPKVILETSNTATAFRLATSGLGVCFVSDMVTHTTKAVNDYELFEIENIPVKWDVAVSYLKNSYLTIAEKCLIDISKEMAIKL
ncbi:LysR family transcriptional regulator [Romboutsia weinsteinii]|uniref:LysR family transcriptional regulator n=1 Tax=Romboutsia weinsteinii TaxID=2020949 RepID=A0A371IZV8_9FIRM|nr:LysR family transcriptional regulator [Romboutsia weinsteinii]RDY26005.1 LysR family transcriptional regulator [Romboutsia weinsteinii]